MDPTVLSKDRSNCLHHAAKNGKVSTFKMFLDYKCDPLLDNSGGYSPLFEACRSGKSDILMVLHS